MNNNTKHHRRLAAKARQDIIIGRPMTQPGSRDLRIIPVTFGFGHKARARPGKAGKVACLTYGQ